ncbi:MAG TPA: aminotransferase class I/II-fold pyridoxal phosphate-dependent enzyme [Terriglobales bacterium]|nr:aminotransferase class I/II-fold pyridoxal phosphate-dependent enzyme [Terriglobales bacterium]
MNRRDFGKTFGAALGATLVPSVGLPDALLAQHALRPDGKAIQLDSNENPYGPSPAACAAITGSEPVACRYPDISDEHMVARLSSFYQLPSQQILIGCGSTEILRCADMAFLGAGKGVIASDPTFEAVLGFAKLMQANPIKVPQTADHRHDLKAMAAAANDAKDAAGLVYICNPNNPTGTIVSLDELDAFMKAVPATLPVLVDEAYFDFVADPGYGTVYPWIARYPNLMVARTFSKVYGMAGMRLGYALGSPQNIAAMGTYKLGMNANVAVLQAAMASFGDKAHVADQQKKMIATREWLYAELKKDGREYIPSHGNFVMINLKQDIAPTIVAFRERGILVGRKFPPMDTWLRVTVGKPEEMQAFVTGLRQIVAT